MGLADSRDPTGSREAQTDNTNSGQVSMLAFQRLHVSLLSARRLRVLARRWAGLKPPVADLRPSAGGTLRTYRVVKGNKRLCRSLFFISTFSPPLGQCLCVCV